MTIEIKRPELEAMIEELKKSGANLDDLLFDGLDFKKRTELADLRTDAQGVRAL